VFGDVLESDAEAASGDGEQACSPGENDSQGEQQGQRPKPPKGHGRNSVDAYWGAEKIVVPLEILAAGDCCHECVAGTVYDTGRPGVLIRFVSQAPVQATVYQLQKLRCNLCGKVFTAPAPENSGSRKYDATVGSMIALLKYGCGMPLHRLQRLQGSLGIPLPASTQWEIVDAKAETVKPAFVELIRQAAQGNVVYNDDTIARILEYMGKRAARAKLTNESLEDGPDKDSSKRSGMFTTGIVSTFANHRIALFLTGHNHAGENLKEVLAHRAAELERPIQMCDALSRNMPAELQTIVANCLAHGRRQFVDVVKCFPGECRHVLEALKVVYKNDAIAREEKLTPEERLRFHQTHSEPVMKDLKAWLARQFEDRLVEPNSGLGKAISYLLKHWEKLTLFLRKAGAPLDNNICERALKKAILHRKNALFYLTQHGADVGDMYMSFIHTCELCGANPLDYLNQLEWHADEVAVRPENWMPWNYRLNLDGATTIPSCVAAGFRSPLSNASEHAGLP
jgi:transposase